MKHTMMILLAICFLALPSHAAQTWIKGDSSGQLTVTNTIGDVHEVDILPALGFESAPFMEIPDAIWSEPEFVSILVQTVPRDEELVSLLKLTDADFETTILAYMKYTRLDIPNKKTLSKKQISAWKTFNKNWKVQGPPFDVASKNMSLTFDVKTFYGVSDFEVSSHQGEGGEWRSICYAGFPQKFELIVSKVDFPDDASLTKSVQGIIGTKFTSNTFPGAGKTFLEMVIDNEDPDFAEKCKAQKELL